jgi:hypothetical protein
MLNGLRGICAAICTGLARPCHRFLRWRVEVICGCGVCLVHGWPDIAKEMSEKAEGMCSHLPIHLRLTCSQTHRTSPSWAVALINRKHRHCLPGDRQKTARSGRSVIPRNEEMRSVLLSHLAPAGDESARRLNFLTFLTALNQAFGELIIIRYIDI